MWLCSRECRGNVSRVHGTKNQSKENGGDCWQRGSCANHLIAASRYSNKIATKDQVVERAKQVIAECTRRDDNIRRLDKLVNNGDLKGTKQGPWNVIIARAWEGYNSVDGNIVCPACMNVTPNILTLCLHCHGRFFSCGSRNTVSTDTVIEIDDDDEEAEKKGDPEAKETSDTDKEEQEIIDKAKMENGGSIAHRTQ